MFDLNEPEQQTLFLQAFRYALGRRTYAVQDTADIIKKYWHQLDSKTQLLIGRDLNEAITKDTNLRNDGANHRPLGMDMDRAVWLDLAKFIDFAKFVDFDPNNTGDSHD
jgi:hypothetical protein